MFCPQDLVGLSSKSKVGVYLNGRRAYKVKLHMLQFTQKGMAEIGRLINDISYRFGLHPSEVRHFMKDRLYNIPPNPSLYFLFSLPQFDVDIHAEIPRSLWRYTEMTRERNMSVYPPENLKLKIKDIS